MNPLFKYFTLLIMAILSLNTCKNVKQADTAKSDDFNYFVDQFEDMRVLKYKLPGFESLSLQQKKLIYYLGEAALAGRDILWDQNFRYNLLIRKTIEAIIEGYPGDKEVAEYKAFLVYAKGYSLQTEFIIIIQAIS